eukprot:1194675-Prorocentrum_minimum.AAC.3
MMRSRYCNPTAEQIKVICESSGNMVRGAKLGRNNSRLVPSTVTTQELDLRARVANSARVVRWEERADAPGSSRCPPTATSSPQVCGTAPWAHRSASW